MPSRLAPFLSDQGVPAKDIYLENYKADKYGWLGNLETRSRAVFDTPTQNVDWCKENLDWKDGVESGIYGPMGEDLLAQSYLVKMVDACESDGPEAEKAEKESKKTTS